MFSEQWITWGIESSGRGLILDTVTHTSLGEHIHTRKQNTDAFSVATKKDRLEIDAANRNLMVVSLTERKAKSEHKDT
jgi:hypothetical protein